MPIPFAAIDGATIAALNAGDEKALEKIFRTHYDALLERANERLKDEPSAAPRLVTATVRELWEERAGFHTTAEIEAFFNEELRHRARAARARMASVHRFEKTEKVETLAPRAAPGVDALWSEIMTALHQPVVDPAEAAKQRRADAAHDAASHIAQVSAPRSRRTPILMASLGAIVVVGGVWWANRASKAEAVSRLLGEAEAEAVVTRPGQSGSLSLPDGSAVRLAAESRLVVVSRFGKDYRVATATGSASITVAPDNALPLEIRIGDVSVRASAGEFAVRNFADDSLRFVQARAAGVRVLAAGGDRSLDSGETVAITRAGVVREATPAEAAQHFAWLDGRMVLRDVTIALAAQRLWRWYGIEVTVADSSARDRLISISVPLGSSKAAIEAISGAGGVTFGYEDNKMVFRNTPPPAATRRKAR